jgi:glycine cleavage system H protein
MNFPENLYYSKEHTWLKVEGEVGTIGITEFAQGELGEIVYVDMPNIGITYQQNAVFGSIEALKTVSDLFMPIHGKVLETNATLLKEPTLVNTDPLGAGWIMKVTILNLEELANLLSATDYTESIK